MDYLATATSFLFFSLIFFPASKANASPDKNPFCSSSPKSDPSDLSVIHIYGKCSPFNQPKSESWADTVIKMASNDPERIAFLASLLVSQKTASVPIASGQQIFNIGNYLVRVNLGTPGQRMFMVLDTSYDAAWVPCSECTGCGGSSTALFSPSISTSFGSLQCSAAECTQKIGGLACPSAGSTSNCLFNQTYGGDSSFLATLSQDCLTLGKDVVPNYVFGCINAISGKSIPPQGLLGLGRGPLSLVSQSNPLYKGVFSYCLPSFKSYYFSGSLKLGPTGQPRNIRTTPLLQNPHRPSLYYVNLTGISVGRVKVSFPQECLAFNPYSGAGTIIDSGTVITRFVQPVYSAIREEFRKQIGGSFSSLGAFDTCFTVDHERVAPTTITLHFTNLDLALPMENTLIHSSAGSIACLAMASASSNVNSVLNVIASLQQQNLRILYDVANARLGIAHENCN